MGNSSADQERPSAYVSSRLRAAPHTSPNGVFHVIAQSSGARSEAQAVSSVHAGGESISAASADVASDDP